MDPNGKLQRIFELESQNEQLRADIGVLQQRFHSATEQAARTQATNESLQRMVRVLETKDRSREQESLPQIAQLRCWISCHLLRSALCGVLREELRRTKEQLAKAENAHHDEALVDELQLKLMEAQASGLPGVWFGQ